ncbi:MAG: riboflavin biosynthesis protein RibF [Duncaniella sp.]|nr:riboflavin biosynthesis protein RibF [Duncaniella sp.]
MKLITKPDTSRRRIAAVGMYDGVHPGHRFLLEYLSAEANSRGLSPAAVTFSRHPLSTVRPLEAPSLLTTLEDKIDALAEAGAKEIILLSFNDRLRRLKAEEFISLLHTKFGIDALVLGFNNRFGHDGPEGIELYREIGDRLGVDIVSAPEYRGPGAPVSSSRIRRMLLEGDTRGAAALLGHPYALRGRVEDGNKVGRTLGYATANLRTLSPDILVPKPGVYAAFVTTPDGEHRMGMVNIGYRPTVAGEKVGAEGLPLTIEAHILDYQGYLYGEDVRIEFVEYMRPERKFDNIEKLRAQLADDEKKARKILG